MLIELQPFAADDRTKKITVTAELKALSDKTLQVAFIVGDHQAQILWPAPAKPGERGDKLYEHTCLEIFFKGAAKKYCEINASPSGKWQSYGFDDYRKAAKNEPVAWPPKAFSRHEKGPVSEIVFLLDVSGYLNFLSAKSVKELSIGLTAVIEAKDASKSYWATKHCGDKPDFHLPGSFIVKVT